METGTVEEKEVRRKTKGAVEEVVRVKTEEEIIMAKEIIVEKKARLIT